MLIFASVTNCIPFDFSFGHFPISSTKYTTVIQNKWQKASGFGYSILIL